MWRSQAPRSSRVDGDDLVEVRRAERPDRRGGRSRGAWRRGSPPPWHRPRPAAAAGARTVAGAGAGFGAQPGRRAATGRRLCTPAGGIGHPRRGDRRRGRVPGRRGRGVPGGRRRLRPRGERWLCRALPARRRHGRARSRRLVVGGGGGGPRGLLYGRHHPARAGRAGGRPVVAPARGGERGRDGLHPARPRAGSGAHLLYRRLGGEARPLPRAGRRGRGDRDRPQDPGLPGRGPPGHRRGRRRRGRGFHRHRVPGEESGGAQGRRAARGGRPAGRLGRVDRPVAAGAAAVADQRLRDAAALDRGEAGDHPDVSRALAAAARGRPAARGATPRRPTTPRGRAAPGATGWTPSAAWAASPR